MNLTYLKYMQFNDFITGINNRKHCCNKIYSRRICKYKCYSNTIQQNFPLNYDDVINKSQLATKKALSDGKRLIEIEFPTISLNSVSGDGEGGMEMSLSMMYLKKFCNLLKSDFNPGSIKIFFPDQNELQRAMTSVTMNNLETDFIENKPIFKDVSFKLDYLTKPTGLMDLGIDINNNPIAIASKIEYTDEIYIIAYPHFNVNEMIQVSYLWDSIVNNYKSSKSIIVFNGELDRIRSGYYPSFFYPKIGKLAKDFIPLFTQAFYIHNFKGSNRGVLYRCYPDSWQILQRNFDNVECMDKFVLLENRETMPSLKEVSMNILSNTKLH